jgi:hypothetical protein
VVSLVEGGEPQCKGTKAKTQCAHASDEEHIRTAGNARSQGCKHKNNVAWIAERCSEIDDGQCTNHPQTGGYIIADRLHNHGGNDGTEDERLDKISRFERGRTGVIIRQRNQGSTQKRQQKGEHHHFQRRVLDF